MCIHYSQLQKDYIVLRNMRNKNIMKYPSF